MIPKHHKMKFSLAFESMNNTMQKLTYKTIDTPHLFEIPKIKGSRFFATLFPVSDRESIDQHLETMRKKYYDATHNCYARRLWVQPQKDLFWSRVLNPCAERANDDWEPTNTAGKPILSVLTGAELFDILVVVTRYFGGTLLGVWGLIQAYTETTKAWVQHLQIIHKEITKKIKLTFSYDQLSYVQYLISKYESKVLEQHYADTISQTLEVNLAFYDVFCKELIDRQIQILN